MAYTRNPTWVDGPGGGTPITAAKLNNIEQGIEDAVVGDVHFEVGGRVDSVNLAATAWGTYPLNATAITNIGGGSWSASSIYTVPVTGLYLCLGGIRIADSAAARSVAMGIGTNNADAPFVLWNSLGGTGADSRSGRHFQRLTRFTAGDQVRMFIYSDGATFDTMATGAGQFLSLTKIAA